MTPSLYTEDTLVQQTVAEYLECHLGWESVYAHNNEDYDSLFGRSSDREKHDLIRDGVKVTFPDFKGARVTKRLRVIDFDDPDANRFLCVRELWIRGDLYRRRADIIGFVNGLPLLLAECKNIHTSLRAAFEKNYSDYRDTIPHIFHYNAVKMEIRNFLLDDRIGLPDPAYSDREVAAKTEAVFRHIHCAYPRLPSPVYGEQAA